MTPLRFIAESLGCELEYRTAGIMLDSLAFVCKNGFVTYKLLYYQGVSYE